MSEDPSLDCDTNSWHYKVIEKTWKNYHWTPIPRNFCPYMRKLVLSLFALPFVLLWRKFPESIRNYEEIALVLFVYGVIVHAVYGILLLVSGGVYIERVYEEGSSMVVIDEIARNFQWWWASAFYLASIAVVGVVIGAVVLVCDYLDERKRKRRELGADNTKSSLNLMRTYIDSKHNKICPRMKFYNSKEEKKSE